VKVKGSIPQIRMFLREGVMKGSIPQIRMFLREGVNPADPHVFTLTCLK
jgi:hypothetical protein